MKETTSIPPFVSANEKEIVSLPLPAGVTLADEASIQSETPEKGRAMNPMLTISNTIRRTRTPDGGILLDVERGKIFCLNLVGSEILELLGAGLDEAQIAAQVSASYGTDIGAVRADLQDFLEALSLHHILEQGAPSVTSEGDTIDDSTNRT